MMQELTISNLDLRDAFFEQVYELACKDSKLMFLTADMGAFALNKFKADLPGQYINMGVAEQSMVSVAAGLALGGRKVFAYAIASFMTQRCFEQVKIDLAYMRLPVTIVGAGPGITYSSDGPTHHAIEDIAIMRTLPNIVIFNPSDSTMAASMAKLAYASREPVYLRIDRGMHSLLYSEDSSFSDGLSLLKNGHDLLIVVTGLMVHQALKAADELAKHSLDVGVIDLYRIKPVNKELLLSLVKQTRRVVTLEEHSIVGGIGSAVSEILVDQGLNLPLQRLAIPQDFKGYGSREWMHEQYGLDIAGICKRILKQIGK